MLRAARDITAILFLEQRLAALREAYIARVQNGSPPPGDFMTRGENAAYRELCERFYNPDIRAAVWPEGGGPATDEEDFRQRTQKLAEYALLMTHRTLAGIPYVGQPESGEDGA